MVDLLKAFGRGILYVLAFPFFLVILAVFAAVGLLAFIFQLFKSIFFFFTGQKFFPELPEDKELRLMKEAEDAKKAQEETTSVNNQGPQNIMFDEVLVQSAPKQEPAPTPKSVEEACFQDSFKKEEPLPEVNEEPAVEEPAPTPLFEEVRIEETKEELVEDPLEDILSAIEPKKPVQKEEENLEIYRPKGSENSFQIEDNEDTSIGVDINFDD